MSLLCGRSCSYVLEGGLWGYDAEPMTGWQAWHSNWNKSLLQKKNWIHDCRVNRALSILRCRTILWYVWCIHLNGICWISYPNKMQIFETWQLEWLVTTRSHKTKCIVHWSNNNMSANGMPPAFQFDTFLTALQNAIGQGAKSDVRLAKRLFGRS
jgi:hypothetical protein